MGRAMAKEKEETPTRIKVLERERKGRQTREIKRRPELEEKITARTKGLEVKRAGNQTIEKRTNQGVQTGRETNPKEERERTKNPRRRIINPGKGQERQREEKKRKSRKQKNKKTESKIDKPLIRLVPVVVWRLPNLASICPKHYHGFSRENDVIQISNRKQTRRKRREILRVNMIMHCHPLVVMIRNQNVRGKPLTIKTTLQFPWKRLRNATPASKQPVKKLCLQISKQI